jgi:hypothetical protein
MYLPKAALEQRVSADCSLQPWVIDCIRGELESTPKPPYLATKLRCLNHSLQSSFRLAPSGDFHLPKKLFH